MKDELCVAITASPYGPYDDLVIYRKKKDQSLVLLGSSSGEVGVFNGFGFSKGGVLIWESWAEEGHPHHSFYKTEDYLSGTTKNNYVTGIGDYNFSHICEFRDDGFLVYATDDEGDECPKTKGLPASIVEVYGKDEYKYCLNYKWIKAKK